MQWFENIEQYTNTTPIPEALSYPNLAMVKCFPNGTTQRGWGAEEFVRNHEKGLFGVARALAYYDKTKEPFAFVMRSMPVICVDIDGKNGGVPTARVLNLTKTTAETSKSGNGFHVFYEIPASVWNPDRGYDEFPDMVGLVPGVDIRGTGLVYHHPNQRWNNEPLAPLPASLANLLGRVRDIKRHTRMMRGGVTNLDRDELVIVWDGLKTQLEGNFPVGGRNNKLFAIGAQMYGANYPSWDTAIYERGVEIGLEMSELTEIVKNIENYS